MCGIAGIIDSTNKYQLSQVVTRMTNKMIHRGPDDSGIWVDKIVAFGHRRLSIIDLSPGGAQPKIDPNSGNVITFNGEIYNYKKLKSELVDFNFQTNSDTEVILAAYSKWGFECVKRLKGQFAFALWDSEKKLLFTVRDHMGEKPFYYYLKNGLFIFSSEIRSLLASELISKKLNQDSIVDYLKYQSVNGPNTIVNDIFSLPAASYGVFRNGEFQIKKYWHIENIEKVKEDNYTSILGKTKSLFSDAVNGQMQSDVPLGAFLSGGIDSSAIVAIMAQLTDQPINTFNVSFDQSGFDESYYAKIIAKKYSTKHHQIDLKPQSLVEHLPDILSKMDSPSGDGPNTYIISHAVKQLGLTVALSGLGGDDLFVGYSNFMRYRSMNKYKMFWSLPISIRTAFSKMSNYMLDGSSSNKMGDLLKLPSFNLNEFYGLSRRVFNEGEISKLAPNLDPKIDYLKSNMLSNTDLVKVPDFSKYSIAELNGYTQNVLLKDCDNMGMANSIEIRSPFFDHDLVSYVLAIGDRFKYPKFPKKLLVDALHPMLPDEIVHRKKMGFSFPWDQWMRGELQQLVEEHINNLSKRDIFDKSELLGYYTRFKQKDPSILWSKIWLLVSLESWLNHNKF